MTSMISRRNLLIKASQGSLLAATSLLLPRVGFASSRLDRKLSLYNIHTGEFLKENYIERGEVIPEVLEKIKIFLRDHRNDKTHDIDIRLIHLVNRLQQDCQRPGHPTFDVISGYRSPESNKALRAQSHGVAQNSKHLTGCAIDIKLEHHLRDLKNLATSYKLGGVGYYPKSGFVHVDIRERPTSWGAV